MLFVSVHADPAFEYPFFLGFAGERGWGAGEDCTRNFPLPAGTDWAAYGPALDAALATVRKFAPDAVIVSLGVDTALEDPDSFRLTAADYPRIGAALAGLERPTLIVQEGGYCLDVIGRNVAAVLGACRRTARASQSSGAPFSRSERALESSASTIAHTAPTSNTSVEYDLANGPAARTPSGTVPPKSMIHNAMTRPRCSSRSCFWMMVDRQVMTRKYR